MQSIPESVNDFVNIRQDNLLYVDKTAYLHKLICDLGRKYVFISRPRRFGKSLMLFTLKAIFQGKKELFNGLAISKTDYDWEIHPVIHLNMGFCAAENYDFFSKELPAEMERALSETGWVYDATLSCATNFGNAIDMLYAQGHAPVILVDEYDDPVARTRKIWKSQNASEATWLTSTDS